MILLGMAIKRWKPRTEPTTTEQRILKRLTRVRKLFAFLRMHRHEIMIDRGYLNSEAVNEIEDDGGEIVCKPWPVRNSRGDLFDKTDFTINARQDDHLSCRRNGEL